MNLQRARRQFRSADGGLACDGHADLLAEEQVVQAVQRCGQRDGQLPERHGERVDCAQLGDQQLPLACRAHSRLPARRRAAEQLPFLVQVSRRQQIQPANQIQNINIRY